jgi:hypothetical protein
MCNMSRGLGINTPGMLSILYQFFPTFSLLCNRCHFDGNGFFIFTPYQFKMTELKHLPKDESGNFKRNFTANGKNYTIRTRAEGIGIYRTSQFLKMELLVGAGMDQPQLVAALKDLESEINQFGNGKGNFLQTALKMKALLDQVYAINRSRFAINFFFCSLFIVRDDEDLTKWTLEDQEEKISDWNAEYNENDFLELGESMLTSFAGTLKERSQSIAPTNQPPQ